MGDSTDARLETEGGAAVAEHYCPCERQFSGLDYEHHDWLLNFEGRGLAGALDLFAYAERSAESGTEEGKLSWVDLPQFTAMHRWDQPADVYDLVSIIDQMVRYHQGMMPGAEDLAATRMAAAVSSLRAELAELRRQLATEVRTRRLVVIDPKGFERVVAETTDDYGAVSVVSPEGCHVSLVADEQSAEPSAELFLSGGGNGAGRFGVIGYGEYVVNEQGHHRVDPETADWRASVTIHAPQRDERFRDVGLDCEGLHVGGR